MRRRMGFAAVAVLLGVLALCGWDYLRPVRPPRTSPAVDRIVVEKAAHRMTLLHGGAVQRVFTVALGRGGPGTKLRAGDNKVPEGTYRITSRNPRSAFHLSLRIGYPTQAQVTAARRAGIDPGGDVMIHGLRRGVGWIGSLHQQVDWTRGCIAVTNAEIEQIWALVPDGATIVIKP